MVNVAVISTDETLSKPIREYFKDHTEDFLPAFPRDYPATLQYLNYELPEICIINCSDQLTNYREIFEEIRKDPWLHYGSVILIHESANETELLAETHNLNIITSIRRNSLDFYFPRLLKILAQNRSFLFQRDIQSLLSSYLSGSFILDNDPFDLTTYSNLLTNFLYNSNLISTEQKNALHAGIMELLINAIEHGNCRISYTEKSAWLEQGKDILELIREKNKDPETDKKKVHLSYRITPEKSFFTVVDEGDGFDWRSHRTLKGEKGLDEMHGRGILMANHYLSELTYNDAGNEVSFTMENAQAKSNLIPQLFTNMEEIEVEDGETVFEQGEESSHLYYIVSGTYRVDVNGKTVSTLKPDDIFLGEMSFLLNNRRSATVISVGSGILIRISKEAFINAIKESPHYGLFLARLLAQRLVQLHDLHAQNT